MLTFTCYGVITFTARIPPTLVGRLTPARRRERMVFILEEGVLHLADEVPNYRVTDEFVDVLAAGADRGERWVMQAGTPGRYDELALEVDAVRQLVAWLRSQRCGP